MVAPRNMPVETASPEIARLIDHVRESGEVVITRDGRPVAKVVALGDKPPRPRFGYGKGTVLTMSDDFDAYGVTRIW